MMSVPTNCPIREHTGDGAYVGRCDFYLQDGKWCPRHGLVSMYPNNDDRDVSPSRRFFDPLGKPEQRQEIWSAIAIELAMQGKVKYAWQARRFSKMEDPPRAWPKGHPLHIPTER